MSADRVILWRHGRTSHNHNGVWQGQLDIPLDDVGRAQAADAAAVLAAGLSGAEPVAVASSDLSRARETAAVLAGLLGRPVVEDPRLREIDAGRWQGMSRIEIASTGMADELAAWMRGEDVRVGGGERRSEAALRCSAAIEDHAAAMPGGTLVVTGHGGVLRGSVVTLLGMPPDRWQVLGVLGNAHWAELSPAPGPGDPWRLLSYNTAATPVPNQFEVPPPVRGRLAEPRR